MPSGLLSATPASDTTGCKQLKRSSLTISFFLTTHAENYENNWLLLWHGDYFVHFECVSCWDDASQSVRVTREHLWRLWTSWDAKMKSRRWNNRPKGTLEEKERQARRRWLASPRVSGYLWKHRWSCIILRNDAVVPCVSGQGSGWHCMTISTDDRARSATSSDSLTTPPSPTPHLHTTNLHLTSAHWGSFVNNILLRSSQSLVHFHSWLIAKPPPDQSMHPI